jgi:hypothetical protein
MIRGREARVRDFAHDPALAESGVERVADPAHEVRNGNQARAMAAERKIELPSHGRPTLSEQVAGHLYVALEKTLDELLDYGAREGLAVAHSA